MDISLAVDNYEVALALGGPRTTNSIKIFPKRNTDRVRHVFVRFGTRDNDDEPPQRQLLEEPTTRLSVVRLFLGERLRPHVLDFLRNEKNQTITFTFDPERFQSFSFVDADDDNRAKDVKAFDLSSFALHSRNAGTPRKRLTPILDADPVIGQ